MKNSKPFLNFIFSPYFLSFLAIAISLYTLWDNKFHFRLRISAGKQLKLFVGKVDQKKYQPIILLSLALINSGGKTEHLDDIKILVKIISNNQTCLEREFEIIREFNSLLGYAKNIKQTEISPIVIAGKTTEIKKYVFYPSDYINQKDIPKEFTLDITVMTKYNKKWKKQKEYSIEQKMNNVWQDLEKELDWVYNTRNLSEKK